MSSFPLRLPNNRTELAAAQAEAERSFAARAKRAVPGQAYAPLARAGQGNAPRPEDKLD